MGSDLSRFTSAHTSMRKAPRKASTRSARLGALQASSKANQSPTADPAVRSRDSAERPGGDENDENQGNKENEEIGVKKKGDARVRCPPLGEQQCRKRSAGNLEVLDGRKDLSALESAQGTPGTRWPIEGVSDDDVSDLGCLRLEDRSADELGVTCELGSLQVVWEVSFEECLEKLQNTQSSEQQSGVKLARRFASHMFKLHFVGSRIIWRLLWIPKDHDDETLSLYLECVSCKPENSAPVLARFNLSMSTRLADSADIGVEHTFTNKSSIWGAQRFVRVCDLQNQQSSSSLVAKMRITWCRDTMLFPPRSITMSESNPEMYLVSTSPRILIVENLLNLGECEKIIGLARPLVKRSRVSTGTETPSRTSSSMFFTRGLETDPNIFAVEGKISQLMQRDDIRQGRRFEKSEAMQAVKYTPGQFYSEHYDNRAGHAQMRAATIICYLSDVDAGGATYFPKSCGIPSSSSPNDESPSKNSKQKPGLRIFPKRGRGLVFWSRLPNGEEDRASLHGGEPVLRGEKWIATRWFKELDDEKPKSIEE